MQWSLWFDRIRHVSYRSKWNGFT